MNSRKYIPLIVFIFFLATDIFVIYKILSLNIQNNAILVLSIVFMAIMAIILYIYSVKEIVVYAETSAEETIKDVNIKETSSENINKLEIEPIIEKLNIGLKSSLEIEKYTEKLLTNFSKEFDLVQGLAFLYDKNDNLFHISGKYAYFSETEPSSFKLGENLTGQAAKNQKILTISKIPEDYTIILSGLGESKPKCLKIIPIVHENNTIAVVEFASFKTFNKDFDVIFNKMMPAIGKYISEKITK